MPNQQLVGYIKQQLTAGVSKETISAALLGAGWPQTDVNDALAAATAKAAPAEPAQPKQTEKISNPGPSVFSPTEVIFQPEAVSAPAEPAPVTAANPVSAKESSVGASSFLAGIGSRGSGRVYALAAVCLGISTLVFLGLAIFFYLQPSAAGDRIALMSLDNSKISSQLSNVTTEKRDLESKLAKLVGENDDLAAQVQFFAAAAGEEASFRIRGTLLVSTTSQMSLATSRNVIIFIKSFQDSKIESDARALAGTLVEITGVHAPASRVVTVTSIKGLAAAQAETKAVVLPPAAAPAREATSSASTAAPSKPATSSSTAAAASANPIAPTSSVTR